MNLLSLSRHFLLLLAAVMLIGVARAQDIYATVAPNIGNSDNFVDLPNTTGGLLYFFTNPSPSAARMAKVTGGTGVAEWPSLGNFAPDPNNSFNRIFETQTLRVYPKTLAAGTTILIEFSYSPVGTRYYYRILVTAGAQVTSIVNLDSSPTAEVSVRWRVTFDTPVSNVTANNFAFSSGSGGVTGVSITSVVPDTAQPSSSWTVTANTGSYLGLLYLNWAGQRTESPPVPNTFTGFPYTFQSAPFFDQDLGPVTIDRSSTTTLNVHATMRNGATVYYEWYIGSTFDTNPVLIPGATGTATPRPSSIRPAPTATMPQPTPRRSTPRTAVREVRRPSSRWSIRQTSRLLRQARRFPTTKPPPSPSRPRGRL